MSTYSTGSVTLAQGSDLVNAALTLWRSQVRPGDLFVALDHMAVVKEVVSNTQLRLMKPWHGPSVGGSPYFTVRTGADWYSSIFASEQINAIVANLELLGTVGPGAPQAPGALTGAGAAVGRAFASGNGNKISGNPGSTYTDSGTAVGRAVASGVSAIRRAGSGSAIGRASASGDGTRIPGATGYDTLSEALFTRMQASTLYVPTTPEKAAIDGFIGGLRSTGLLALMHAVYWPPGFGTVEQNVGRATGNLNWLADTFPLYVYTVGSQVITVPRQSVASDGTIGSSLLSDFNPEVQGVDRDNFGISVGCVDQNTQSDAYLFGGGTIQFRPRGATNNNAGGRMHDASTTTATGNTDSRGFYSFVRTGPGGAGTTHKRFLKNGAFMTQTATSMESAATARANSGMNLLSNAPWNPPSPQPIDFFLIHQGLSLQQHQDLNSLVTQFRTAIAAA